MVTSWFLYYNYRMRPDSPLETLFRIAEPQKKALKKLRIKTAEDLLYHFPARYGDVAEIRTIGGLVQGETVVIFGHITKLQATKAFHKKIPMGTAELRDDSGKIQIVWFNQPYIAKMIPEDALVRVEGRVSERRPKTSSDVTRSTTHDTRSLYFSNPKIEKVTSVPTGVGGSLFGEEGEAHHLHPVYPESHGITSNWLFHHIQKVIASGALDTLIDPVPPEILEKYHLPSLKTALIFIHAPQKADDAVGARKRFAFEEVFFIQLEKQKERKLWQKEKSFTIEKGEEHIALFTKRFPFSFTNAQNRAVSGILEDFRRGIPMARLLEGDVGSGKTAVAASTAYAVITSRPKDQNYGTLQVAYMAPTEILATQHFESFIEYFKHLPMSIALITGSGCRKFPSKTADLTQTSRGQTWTDISRSQLLKWVANGEIAILIGTHALIQKSVQFKYLAYVIIDEQHRFGVKQRQALVTKDTSKDQRKSVTEPFNPLLYRDLTYRIREAVFRVKKELGLGHKEIVYQKALAEEFERSKLAFSRECRIPILYRSKKVGEYIPDFVVANKVIVELKAIPQITSTEVKQLWHYLKGSEFLLALLVNFSFKTVDIKRVVYEKSRSTSASMPQGSASSPRQVRILQSASMPHLLSMTATPIPRTLALTVYGDLDLTVLDEQPAGRKPIITEIVLPTGRDAVYEKVRKELQAGRQAYIITPRIDEPDPDKEFAVLAKSAKAEAKRLKEKVFQEYEIGVMHSKLKPNDKEKVMSGFKNGKIHILVSTSVVEVGVNVPNATSIILEGAERFGLAQLHQLRGRVLRSSHQAYCYVFTESAGAKTADRLKALQTAKNGFELAEYDLKFRGAGELSGRQQWGVSDVAMEALQNLKMVEAARAEAKRLLEADETLSPYPLLRAHLASRKQNEIHFE